MAKFDKLTDGDRKRLARLEEQVKRAQSVTDDDVRWHFVNLTGGAHIQAIGRAEIDGKLAGQGKPKLETVAVDELHLKRWAETGCISVLPSRDSSFGNFLLTPRGEDYLTYCRKCGLARWFVDLWSDLRTEVVSAAISAVISIVVSLVTAYLVLTLNLTK